MTTIRYILLGAGFGLPTAFAAVASDATPIFDGRSLDGWEGNPAIWRVEDGAITGEINEGATLDRNEWIFWKGEVGDFDLEVEYRLSGGSTANSGIQFRSQRHDDGAAAGYQADLDSGTEWLGRIYDEDGRGLMMERGTRVSIAPDGRRWSDEWVASASFKSVPVAGGWNTYRVRAAGPHMEVWINGIFFGALDDHDSKESESRGRLAFQLHAGPGPSKVQFRRVTLRDQGRTDGPPPVSRAVAGPEDEMFHPAGASGRPLNLDFEKGTLEDWTAEGDAWEGQPVKGDTVRSRKPGQRSRHTGTFWIGGYEPHESDKGTGTLTSAPFAVTHPWASFLVGAGGDVGAARVEIVVAATGAVFHTATGRGEEDMHREVVNLSALMGQTIAVRLVDRGAGGWEHLNFDDFVFHNRPPAEIEAGGSRQTQSPVLWHLRPNPANPTAVANTAAQETVAGMMLTSGFQAELIAAEPDVRQPIAFCIDEKGRLWVVEGLSYPNKKPAGQGADRVLIFSDRDGDGTFDQRTVFIDGLNLVSGIEVGFGGVWIGAAPQLLFIPDRDHDDRPDGPPEVLLDGWGYQDTHETLNSFTWGPDGWLYGHQGVFTNSRVGRPGAPDGERVPLHSAVWRYHPVRHEFEIFAHGGSNQWGLDYNEAGHLFMTHCRSFFGGGGTTHVIRNGHFWNQANAGYGPYISNEGPDFAPELKNYLPAAAKYDSGEGGAGKPGTTAIYGGHSHVGTLIYQGENWPEMYRDHLFTHNLHGHQINHQVNVRQGSGYETMPAGADLMFTPDPRYIAVDLQTGPDGAVYVIDWCDQQHCHSPVEEKWDRTNGRIYRVSWAATYAPVSVNLSTMSSLDLANLQTSRNDWMGRTARRLLQERAAAGPLDGGVAPALRRLAASAEPRLSVRGLWSLHLTGNLTADDLQTALRHDSDLVRAWAIQLATEQASHPRVPVETLIALARDDPSPTVRLALASALPALPEAAVWEVAAALSLHAEDAGDRFLPKLIWTGLAPVEAGDFGRALALAEMTALPALADSIRWLAATSAPGREALFASPGGAAGRTVRLAAFALRTEASLPMPAAWRTARALAATSSDRAVREDADQLAAVFGETAVLTRMRETLADSALPLPTRMSALALLRRTGDPSALPVFRNLLDDPAFRPAVIPLLGRSDDPATAAALLDRFGGFNSAERTAALAVLSSRAVLALPLLKAMESGSFEKKHLTSLHIRQMRSLGDPACNALLEKTWGRFNETPAATRDSIARIKALFREAPLWAYESSNGRAVFDTVCATCHAMGAGAAAAGRLGPDLSGSWNNGPDYFIENIVDPNAVVGEAFQLSLITLNDGTVVSGAVEAESPSRLTVRTITGPVSVAVTDVKDRQKLEQSIMPPGLLEALPERQMLELLKFLTSKP